VLTRNTNTPCLHPFGGFIGSPIGREVDLREIHAPAGFLPLAFSLLPRCPTLAWDGSFPFPALQNVKEQGVHAPPWHNNTTIRWERK
jgi:hypothetical protein